MIRGVLERPSVPPSRGALRAALGLSMLVATLMTVASSAGLLWPALYHDNGLVAAGWLGNDLVTLVIAVPGLLLAVVAAARGSVRAHLVCMGMLAYAAYNFAFYLFGAAFNALFLIYVSVVGLSIVALGFGAFSLDASLVDRPSLRPDARGIAAFILLVVVILGGFWLGVSLRAAITGSVPAVVIATGIHTNVIAALDLALIVPSGVLAAVWLWKRNVQGYVLAAIWTVQGTVYMAALAAATVTAGLAGHAPLEQALLWAGMGGGCLASSWVLLGRAPFPADVAWL